MPDEAVSFARRRGLMTQVRSYLEFLTLLDETPLRLARGQRLFEAGAAGDGRMYVVREGTIVLRSGRRVLETVGPGGIVGEMALIDPAPRSATAVAGEDCAVSAVDQRMFDTLVRRVPGLALEVMRILARRLRRTTRGSSRPSAPRRPSPRRRRSTRKTRR
jgi:CRP-like cAMP-binding protein